MKLSDFKSYIKKALNSEIKPEIVLSGTISICIQDSKIIVSYEELKTKATKKFKFKNINYPEFQNSLAYKDITKFHKPNSFNYNEETKTLICTAEVRDWEAREKYYQKSDINKAIDYFFRLRKKHCWTEDFYKEQEFKKSNTDEEIMIELLQCDGGIELITNKEFYIRSLDSGEIAVGNKDSQGYIDEEEVFGYEPEQVKKAVNKFTKKVTIRST